MEQQATPQGVKQWVAFLKDKYLPVQTRTVALLRKLIDDPNSSLKSLQPVVAADPVFSLHAIARANLRNRNAETDVSSVELAVATLGMDRIAEICDQAPVMRLNDASVAQKQYYRAVADSYHAATQAADICRVTSNGQRDEIRTAALVYGVANWTLWRYAPQAMSEIRIRVYEQGVDTALAEYDVLGCTLQEIGEQLALKWRLSQLAATALRHDNSPEHDELEAIHYYAENYAEVDDDEGKRVIKQLLNSQFYPVKLANWFAQTVSYGWHTEKTQRLVEIIADYLRCSTDDAAARLHQNCAKAAHSYHVPGIMEPATQMLLIPSNMVLDYRLEGGTEKGLAGVTVPQKLSKRETEKAKKQAPESPVIAAEAKLLDEALFRQVLERLRADPLPYTEPMPLITDLLRGLKLGLGIERVCLFKVENETLLPCKQSGFDKQSPLPRYTQSLKVPTLFKKLAEKPLAVWIAPHNRERIWPELPERFKGVCHQQSFALISLFVAGEAEYFLYGDRIEGGKSVSEFDFKYFKLLAVAANKALNLLSQQDDDDDSLD